MKIKVCGITRLEDARAAASLGADALGFIFYPRSPRYITAANASHIIKRLPPFLTKVGVFVDEDLHAVSEIVQASGVDTIQLHGSEPPEYCAAIPLPVIKVFSVRDGFDVSVIDAYKGVTAGILLDTWDEERKGGSGKTFDWTAAVRAVDEYDSVILSGGLGPSNIREAIESVRPYAVDVNSGVEISPGVKNKYKMKDVISIVKKY